jgi:hypothetical protein
MKTKWIPKNTCGLWARTAPKIAPASIGLVLVAAGCSSGGGGAGGKSNCTPPDADGVMGGDVTVLVSVSDTAFTVGGVDSGSTEPNIAVQNDATVTLTLTNVGTMPHDMVVECIGSGLPAGCLQISCFPGDAGAGNITLVPTLMPGQSMTVTVVTPLVEGTYPFTSDVGNDSQMGEFVLM